MTVFSRWRALSPWIRRLLLLIATADVGLAAYLLARTLLIVLGLDWLGEVPPERYWEEIRSGLFVVAAALGAPFVVWRTILADQQTHINQQTHFTNLYSKAVEMLGADKVVKTVVGQDETESWKSVERSVPNIEVRLGAIYALERIARESDADHRPIVETLCAYIRQNLAPPREHDIPEAPDPPEDETPEARAERLEAIRVRVEELRAFGRERRRWAAERDVASAARPDIRGALDVLTRREDAARERAEKVSPAPPLPELEERPDDLSAKAARARLARVERRRDQWAVWRDGGGGEDVRRPDRAAAARQARTEGADLRAPRDKALTPEHSVEWARYRDGRAVEGAWRPDLAGAALQGLERHRAKLRRVLLREARMEGADLSGAQMEGVDLSRAQMEGAVLVEARMEGAVLVKARMEGADLSGARMEGADLSGARMEGANLTLARMEGANLILARMEGAVLVRAQLEGANLREARMHSVDASRAIFVGALLASTDFIGARNLTFGQLASAFGDAGTVLPERVDDMDAERARARLIAEAGWAAEKFEDWKAASRDWTAWRKDRGLPPHRWHDGQ